MALSLGNNTNFLIPKANSSLTGSLTLNSSDSLKLEFTPSKTGYYIFDFSQQENSFTSPAYNLLTDNGSGNYMPGQMTTFNHRASPLVELTGGKKYYLILRHVNSSYYGSYINITISEGYKFTATINPSGVARFTTPSLQIVKVGEKVNFNPLLLDNSYMLNNWTKDGNILPEVSWGLTLTASKNNHGEYIANFIKKPPDPVYYEVDLTAYPSNYGEAVILEEGDDYGNFLEGTPITLFANPKLGQYGFQGWYLDSTYAENKLVSTEQKYSTVVTKDINYYAKFQAINSISLNKEQTYTVLQKNQRINISYSPTSAASGKPVIFEVTGDVDLSGSLYIYNNGWSSLKTVIKTGEKREYTFPSNVNQNSYLLSAVCNEDLDTGKSFNFSSYIKNYNVTFIVDNNIYATQKKIYDTNLTLSSETPSKVGHTFKGWGTTSTSTTASYQPGGTYSSNSDLTLYAIWTKNNYTYTVKHQSVSGIILDEYTLTYPFGAEVYIAPQTFTGYVPKSSDSVKVMWDSETPKTILIEYTPIQYSITYKGLEGVTLSNKTSYTIEDNDFTLNNPSKTGYAFDGWTGTGLTSATKTVTIKNKSTGDRTYTANWTPNQYEYNIEYKSTSGIKLGDGTIKKAFGSTYSITPKSFTGYNKPANQNIAWDSIEPKTIIFNGYTPIDYSITYYLNGGKVAIANPTSYNIEDNDFTLNNPTKDGYDFTGWTGTDLTSATKTVTIENGSTGNRTYTANWNNKILTITLDNQSANTAGTTKAYLKYNNGWYSNLGATTQITSIIKPTKKGYTFKGYYTQVNGKGDCIISSNGVPQSNTFTLINTTIYAYWTINYYSITHSMNTDTSIGNKYTVKDASNNSISSGSTYAYDSQIKLEATGNNLQGYDFLRWEINGSSVAASSYTFKLTQDTTIKAYFGKRDMSITVNLYDENNKPSSIPPEEEDSHIKLWIRQLNNDGTYSNWEKKYFNAPIVYSQATKIQVIIQDGEDYEFVSSNNDKFNKYTDILINTEITSSVYFKKIPEINSIYFGKSDKPYTSGYIDDPNLSFKEEISSIWIGGKQIMGKAPTRDYPYLEDTELGDTVYISKNTCSQYKLFTNTSIKKVVIEKGSTSCSKQFDSEIISSIILPNSLKSIYHYFMKSNKIKSLYIPKNLEAMSSNMLPWSQDLEKVVFSNCFYLKSIGYMTFRSATKIQKINLFNTQLEIIDKYGFSECYNLRTIFLPDTLLTINDYAFRSCRELTTVYFKGTMQQWKNIQISNIDNEYLLNATIYCKDGIINPKEEN